MSEIPEGAIQADVYSIEQPIVRNVRNSTWAAIVSLEPLTAPVVTWRGTVSGGTMATAAARAIRAARKANKGVHAKSLVVVIQKP